MVQSSLATVVRSMLFLLAAGLVVLLGCGWGYGWSFVEKLLTRCALPTGLIWLLLLQGSLVAWTAKQRRAAALLLLVCLFYWTFSCTYTGDLAIGLLEGRYQPVDIEHVPEFDVVVVLGGGTSSNEEGNVWLSPNGGDRLMLAARLFHAGRIKHLITTGQLYRWSKGRGVDMAIASQTILQQVGVPPARISRVGGANTSAEMRALRRYFGDDPPARVGLLTSAYHLPRAQRLARREGLVFEPLPAGFLAADEPIPMAFVPSADGLKLWEIAIKEFLAAMVRR